VNFASAPFILLFLPLTLLGLFAIRGERAGPRRMAFLTLASAVFYGASGLSNLLVLALSIAVNFTAGRLLSALPRSEAPKRKAIMWLAVIANIAILLTFKLRILAAEGPDGFTAAEDVLLPLALSFVTFQQIGFVVGCYRGTIPGISLPRYLFFVLFFPQLVMGPIVRFEDVRRQLDEDVLARIDGAAFATGAAVFSLALFKKLVIANSLAPPANRLFDLAREGPVATADAWYAMVTFQFQLFFDFTAYAEMGIGLAMMVGFRIPLNFDRPYFSKDRAELWRRWHISFATFIRGNVFLPLVRRWKWPIVAALAMTGILSGLWHGLGATFVLWGLAQTAILLYLHVRNDRRRRGSKKVLPAPAAIASTFLVTCLLGVLFRSPTLIGATNMYWSLAGLNASAVAQTTWPMVAGTILAGLLIWGAPDFGQLFRGHWRYIELRSGVRPPPVHWTERFLAFRPGLAWGLASGIALFLSLVALMLQGEASRFVYVQF
jgi:alginate O-acetyltransferase complex protein AlgI